MKFDRVGIKGRHVAIAWSGLPRLRFQPKPLSTHQIPWWNVKRWRATLTITTGGVWLIFFGPFIWGRDLRKMPDPTERRCTV